jgi:hypothetical protein
LKITASTEETWISNRIAILPIIIAIPSSLFFHRLSSLLTV